MEKIYLIFAFSVTCSIKIRYLSCAKKVKFRCPIDLKKLLNTQLHPVRLNCLITALPVSAGMCAVRVGSAAEKFCEDRWIFD